MHHIITSSHQSSQSSLATTHHHHVFLSLHGLNYQSISCYIITATHATVSQPINQPLPHSSAKSSLIQPIIHLFNQTINLQHHCTLLMAASAQDNSRMQFDISQSSVLQSNNRSFIQSTNQSSFNTTAHS
ncbi:hypothetical protein GQ44DRAFT_706915 [Phaeosphaeriaceae sp. PMI808]|nr:hypothetical protein GQ44DRAFT_706915 [Phaeosphaeriaceae sp. PMI808]